MLSQVARDLLERRYRLLLSWRDKAAALRDRTRSSREFDLPPGMPPEGADEWFDAQSAASAAALAEMRASLANRREAAQDRVRVAVYRQKRLPDRVAEGKIGAAEANNENRALSAEIEEQGALANLCNQLLGTDSPAELGGRIDLPLPRYEKELNRFALPGKDGGAPPHPEKIYDTPREKVPSAALRGRRPPRFPALTRTDRRALLLAVVATLCVAGFAAHRMFFSGEVRFDLLAGPGGVWRLVCDNDSPREIFVQCGQAPAGGGVRPHTVTLELGAEDGSGFTLFAVPERVWVWRGPGGGEGTVRAVPARMKGEWTLNLNHLSPPEAGGVLRVRAATPTGRLLLEETIPLSPSAPAEQPPADKN